MVSTCRRATTLEMVLSFSNLLQGALRQVEIGCHLDVLQETLSLQKLPRCTFWQLVSPARCYQLMGRQWRRAPRRSRGGAPPLQRIVESSHGAAGSCHKLLIHHLKLLDHHHYQDHLSPIPSSPGVGLLRLLILSNVSAP